MCIRDSSLTLHVHDDGWGLPSDLDPYSGESLGLRIVTTLVRDRGGEFSLVRTDPGTRAELTVPVGAAG